MKQIIIFFVLTTSALFAFSQIPFRKVSAKMEKEQYFFASSLNKKTINLYLKEKNPSGDTRFVLENTDQLNILKFIPENATKGETLFGVVSASYPLNEYTPLHISQSQSISKWVYIKEKGNDISELLVVESSASSATLVELKGKIDLERIALLKGVLNVNGLDALDELTTQAETPSNILQKPQKSINYPYGAPSFMPYWLGNNSLWINGSRPWLINNDQKLTTKTPGIIVYDKFGNKMMDFKESPAVVVNGFYSNSDCRTSLKQINPNCIQSINVMKDKDILSLYGNSNGVIDIKLKGNCNDLFTVCEGTLYFGQNGSLHAVRLDDECVPKLLIDCEEKPLQDIEKLEPNHVKKIELTTNPRDCSNQLEGEYIVLETK